jgi:hypothetical protein
VFHRREARRSVVVCCLSGQGRNDAASATTETVVGARKQHHTEVQVVLFVPIFTAPFCSRGKTNGHSVNRLQIVNRTNAGVALVSQLHQARGDCSCSRSTWPRSSHTLPSDERSRDTCPYCRLMIGHVTLARFTYCHLMRDHVTLACYHADVPLALLHVLLKRTLVTKNEQLPIFSARCATSEDMSAVTCATIVVPFPHGTEVRRFIYSISFYVKFERLYSYCVSETGSVSVLWWGETPILLGPLERTNLSHWTTSSGTLSYINTW